MVVFFIVYNTFFQLQDARLNTAINILIGSVIFLYIAFMALVFLKKIKKK